MGEYHILGMVHRRHLPAKRPVKSATAAASWGYMAYYVLVLNKLYSKYVTKKSVPTWDGGL